MDYLEQSADLSDDKRYRYSLTRKISQGARSLLFVGLNPSTADAMSDDPTIRRCVGFAKTWGFNCLRMGNLYALRATDPRKLQTSDDPIGPRNRAKLERIVAASELVIAAWGGFILAPEARNIADWILQQRNVKCLGQNRDGSPKHPLYTAKTSVPQRWIRKLST